MSGIAAGNIGEVVTIALKAEAKGDVVARSVELIGPSSRARFSFGFDRPLEEAFCPDAAVVIRSLVERIIEHEGILTLPDVTLRLPTLVLSDCFVIATDVSDGGAQIIVRFKQFEGDLFSLFDVPESYHVHHHPGVIFPFQVPGGPLQPFRKMVGML